MQTLVLNSNFRREQAHRLVNAAPVNAVVTISPPKRSTDQNKLMWALLSDVSRAMPQGRKHVPEVWKDLFCHACGHAVQFETGLNGQPFTVGFRTSKMSKDEMGDLIEFIMSWGAENGVTFGDEATQ